MKYIKPSQVLFTCSLEECANQASSRWNFHSKHFCCEDHLIKWIRIKTEQEKHWPLKGGGD